MPTFDAIIFDLGGTLIYFDGDWPTVLARGDRELLRTLQAAGLDLDGERFLAEFRAELNAYYREREAEFVEYTTLYVLRTLLGKYGVAHLPDSTLRAALDSLYAASQAHWRIEPDTLPMLEELKARGYRLGMISNAGDDPDVQVLIDNAGIRSYFDAIVTSAALGIRKPNPQIFHNMLQGWGVAPERAVMVGDTLGADILGARNAGLFSVWITRRADNPANRAHGDTIRPDATIATLEELPRLLERLDRG